MPNNFRARNLESFGIYLKDSGSCPLSRGTLFSRAWYDGYKISSINGLLSFGSMVFEKSGHAE